MNDCGGTPSGCEHKNDARRHSFNQSFTSGTQKEVKMDDRTRTVRTQDFVFVYNTQDGHLTITYEDVDHDVTVILFANEVVAMLELLAAHRETVYRKALERRQQ